MRVQPGKVSPECFRIIVSIDLNSFNQIIQTKRIEIAS